VVPTRILAPSNEIRVTSTPWRTVPSAVSVTEAEALRGRSGLSTGRAVLQAPKETPQTVSRASRGHTSENARLSLHFINPAFPASHFVIRTRVRNLRGLCRCERRACPLSRQARFRWPRPVRQTDARVECSAHVHLATRFAALHRSGSEKARRPAAPMRSPGIDSELESRPRWQSVKASRGGGPLATGGRRRGPGGPGDHRAAAGESLPGSARLAHDAASGELVVAGRTPIHVYLQRGRLAWAMTSTAPLAFTRHLVKAGRHRPADRSSRRSSAPAGRARGWGVPRQRGDRTVRRGPRGAQSRSSGRSPRAARDEELRAVFLPAQRGSAEYDVALTFDLMEVAAFVLEPERDPLPPCSTISPARLPSPLDQLLRHGRPRGQRTLDPGVGAPASLPALAATVFANDERLCVIRTPLSCIYGLRLEGPAPRSGARCPRGEARAGASGPRRPPTAGRHRLQAESAEERGS
jgi:hypothetical protein